MAREQRIAAANGVDVERVKAQRGIKERTAAGLKRSGRHIAQMQQIFRDRGLPIELTYLPIVESSYDINARSNVGALGMWQFMRTTGRQYMRVDRSIDERRDPIESTRAAAAFLQQSYDILGSWPLAITAYNFGPGGMARAVAAIESDNLVDLIGQYNHPYWGFAPKNFYAEFLAAVEIGKNVNQYFPELQLDSPVAVKEVELKNSVSVVALAKSTGLTKDQLLGWNPALSAQTRSVPAGYRVKVPVDSSMRSSRSLKSPNASRSHRNNGRRWSAIRSNAAKHFFKLPGVMGLRWREFSRLTVCTSLIASRREQRCWFLDYRLLSPRLIRIYIQDTGGRIKLGILRQISVGFFP